MVVWFRHGSCTVGVEDGLIRCADFASLTTLLDAAQTLESERQRLLERVAEEIEVLRSDASRQVAEELAAAREARERGHADGLQQGLDEAATQWTATALREGASTQRSLMRQTRRLSQIVSLALERIIDHEDRVTLFNRALNAISKLVRDVPMATLRVSPDDLGSALTAVAAFAPCAAGRLQIEVLPDSGLGPGSCLFESDQGVIDAGLKTQLAAIQRAMDRAAQHMVLQGDAPPAEVVGMETSPTARDDPQRQRAQNDEYDGYDAEEGDDADPADDYAHEAQTPSAA
jgi:type III secretion protein L